MLDPLDEQLVDEVVDLLELHGNILLALELEEWAEAEGSRIGPGAIGGIEPGSS